MPLAQGVQDVNRFSYTFSELSLFCRIFAGFSVIFPYYLEINNIIYKIFGYVETGLWPLLGAGTSKKRHLDKKGALPQF